MLAESCQLGGWAAGPQCSTGQLEDSCPNNLKVHAWNSTPSNEPVYGTCINFKLGRISHHHRHVPECSQAKNSPKVQLTKIVPGIIWIISKMNVEINQERGTSQHGASTTVQSHLGIQDSACQKGKTRAAHAFPTEDPTHIPAKGLQQRVEVCNTHIPMIWNTPFCS